VTTLDALMCGTICSFVQASNKSACLAAVVLLHQTTLFPSPQNRTRQVSKADPSDDSLYDGNLSLFSVLFVKIKT
jgi:hypothetical protein